MSTLVRFYQLCVDNVLEVTARAMTYYVGFSVESIRQIVAFEGAIKGNMQKPCESGDDKSI